jgi:hypothetical protein
MLNVLLWAAGMAAGARTPAAGAAEVKCDQPVYLMVWVEKFDRKKSVPYAEGLRSSGIVARNGGTYRTAGAPISCWRVAGRRIARSCWRNIPATRLHRKCGSPTNIRRS